MLSCCSTAPHVTTKFDGDFRFFFSTDVRYGIYIGHRDIIRYGDSMGLRDIRYGDSMGIRDLRYGDYIGLRATGYGDFTGLKYGCSLSPSFAPRGSPSPPRET